MLTNQEAQDKEASNQTTRLSTELEDVKEQLSRKEAECTQLMQ